MGKSTAQWKKVLCATTRIFRSLKKSFHNGYGGGSRKASLRGRCLGQDLKEVRE